MGLAFSRLLLAFDDSTASHIALKYACALTRSGATLTIAHAVDYGGIASAAARTGFAASAPAPLVKALEDQGSAVLRVAVDACATHGVVAEPVSLKDSAAAAIVEYGRANDVDLIVVGTHGRHGLSRAVLGSVAEDILRSSEVPVLVVTGHARAPRHEHLFRRALVALDESDPAQTAMSVAARLYMDLATHLTLCNVINSRDLPAPAGRQREDASPLKLTKNAAALQLLERAATTRNISASVDDLVVVEGEPAAAIGNAALDRECDLIVIGSHGRRGIKRLFLGSVAEAVVHKSSLPVLVTPAESTRGRTADALARDRR